MNDFKTKIAKYMKTILFLVSFLFQTVLYSQNYEIIRPELESNDFAKTLGFIKRINNEKLTLLFSTKDSVTYLINDTVDYRYSLRNLEAFEQRMKDNELVYLSKIDSVYNKERRSFDYYFVNNDNTRDYLKRKFFNDKNLVSTELEYGENDSSFVTHAYNYDSENRLIMHEVLCATYKFKFKNENIWQNNNLQVQIYLIFEDNYEKNIKIEYNINGLIVSYSYVNKNLDTNEIQDSISYNIEYLNDGYFMNVTGIAKAEQFKLDFSIEASDILLKKEYKGNVTKQQFKLK